MRKILGISAFYHDAAAAICIGGEPVAAAQEERFTRKKHTAEFPGNAIRYCLEETGLELDELDAIAFYDKPLLKFERLLETYYAFAPKGLPSFLRAIPVWLEEKLFLKKKVLDGLKEIGNYDRKKLKLLFPEHHLSHAASAFFVSPFEEAAILTIDGAGEWCTAALGYGEKNKIRFHKEMHFPHSAGLLYSAFTYYLGFKVNSGEYKLMGLAPYGDPGSEQVEEFTRAIKEQLVHIKADGSVWLDQSYFQYATGLKMIREKKWGALFGFSRRKPDEPIAQHHCNLAFAIQTVTEEIVLKMARGLKSIVGSENVCLAGGVALNSVANGKLLKEKIFRNIYIQPAAGDAGGAIGAALAAHYIYFEEERKPGGKRDQMRGAYLGPDYSDKEVERMNKKVKAVAVHYSSFEELTEYVASEIANGKVAGWFQGRMEFGPRALGNRSILADPRDPGMQKKLNLSIKNREGFRPFAPSVLAEDAHEYFGLSGPSPYMLFVAPVKEGRRKALPEQFQSLTILDKLHFLRSDIPAVTHLDFSARVQTVDRETNPRFWKLIRAFKEKTGCAVLINTSFNVRGEPVVCTPLDAYRCFMGTDMDVLVINNYFYRKTEQPDWQDKQKWMRQFVPD
ncbi:MAG: carbamoyltransferase [Lewinellaceae bacterium]|nr:carbamoyltransferase [Lewinellaceae bacterium]